MTIRSEQRTKSRLKLILVALLVGLAVYPFESIVIPAWKLRVIDTTGEPCPNMRVNEGWGHNSLKLQSAGEGDFMLTNQSGYVQFPARTIRASLIRRTVVPLIAHVMVIAHGSTGIHGYVFATGMRDGPLLEYESGRQLPGEIVVVKCYSASS
ncbi:MAG: hypothetical protein C5B55_04460 [Blastocatellia bacterium]|nr:MAG: hypothetical protein C5B55_04460 [Blastocatellia bacterium]